MFHSIQLKLDLSYEAQRGQSKRWRRLLECLGTGSASGFLSELGETTTTTYVYACLWCLWFECVFGLGSVIGWSIDLAFDPVTSSANYGRVLIHGADNAGVLQEGRVSQHPTRT